MRVKSFFAWILILIMFVVFYNMSTASVEANKALRPLKFEVHKISNDSTIETKYSKAIKASKVKVYNSYGVTYGVSYLDDNTYITANIPAGKYFVDIEAGDGLTGKYLVSNEKKGQIAILKVYPATNNSNEGYKLTKETNLVGDKVSKIKPYELFNDYLEGKRNEKSNLVVIPLEAYPLAEDAGKVAKAIGYTSNEPADYKDASSKLEVYRDTFLTGSFDYTNALITNIYFKDFDGDGNDELLVTTRSFTANDTNDRIYLYKVNDDNTVLLKFGDKDFLEGESADIYLSADQIKMISLTGDLITANSDLDRRLVQKVEWKNKEMLVNKIITEYRIPQYITK